MANSARKRSVRTNANDDGRRKLRFLNAATAEEGEVKQRLEFERKEDTTLQEFKRTFNKAFTRPVQEENSIILKDDILEDPLSIKDNIKEEDKN